MQCDLFIVFLALFIAGSLFAYVMFQYYIQAQLLEALEMFSAEEIEEILKETTSEDVVFLSKKFIY